MATEPVKIPVVSPSGARELVPVENLSKAQELGYRVETGEEQIAGERQARGEAQPIRGGVEALGRGATAGLSDVLMRQIAEPGDMAEAAARREALGGYGTALEAGGALATSLLTGGLGTAALGTGLAARLGGGAGARLAGTALASGLETAAFGAGSEASQAALESRDLRAEKLLAAAGLGFAMGGAGAGLLGAGGMALQRGAKATREAVGGLVRRGLAARAERAAAETAADAAVGGAGGAVAGEVVGDVAQGASQRATRAGPVGEATRAASDARATQEAVRAAGEAASPTELGDFTKTMMETVGERIPGTQDIEDYIRTDLRKRAMDQRRAAMGITQKHLNKAGKAMKGGLDDARLESIDTTIRDLDLIGNISSPRDNLKRTMVARDRLMTINDELYDRVDTLNPAGFDSDSAVSRIQKMLADASPLERGSVKEAKVVLKRLRDYLNLEKIENDKVGFLRAREIGTELDEQVSKAFQRQDPAADFLKKLRNTYRDELMDQVEQHGGDIRNQIKTNNTHLRNIRMLEDAGEDALKQTGNRQISLTDYIAGAGLAMGDPLSGIAVAGINKLWREYGSSVAHRALDVAADHPFIGSIARGVTGLKEKLVGEAGVGGLGRTMAAEAGSAGANQASIRASRMAAAAKKLGSAISGGVDAVFTGAPHLARKQAADALPQLSDMLGIALTGAGTGAATDHDQLELTKNDLSKLSNDPELMMERMQHAIEIQAAADPHSTPEFAATTANAVRYLQSIAPKAPTPNSMLGAKPWRPSDAQLHDFKNAVNIVMSPLDVLEKMRQGSLTTSDVKALQAVYPALYTQLSKQVAEAAQRQGDKLSYARRLAVGRFLQGADIERTTSPQYVAAMQANYSGGQEPPPPAQQAQPSGYTPRRASAKTPQLSSFAVTESQRIAARGSAPQ